MKKLINFASLLMLAAFGAVIRADGVEIDKLKEKLVLLSQHARDIQAQADAEERALTEQEEEKIDQIFSEFGAIDKNIKRRERIEAQEVALHAGAGRQTQPDDITGSADSSEARHKPAREWRQPRDPVATGRHGFNDFGEFCQAVCAGSRKTNAIIDPRLVMDAPSTYGNEGAGADGGFAVAPEFKREIMQLVEDEEDLLGLTDGLTTSSNSLTLPKDETTPWQDSGGIQCYWDGECLTS